MINTTHFKTLLEEEKKKLEEELSSVGRINPSNPNDWEAVPEDMNTMRADKNEAADAVEEYEINSAVEAELEKRLTNIKDALVRIENDKYGICLIGGEEIEEDRLNANPSARTCKAHINE